MYGTPAVRLTKSTWISHIGVTPVLSKATQFHNRRDLTLSDAPVPPGLSKVLASVKSFHGLTPAYVLNEFSHSRDFHSYDTRYRDLLPLPLARTTSTRAPLGSPGAKIWNTLPVALRSHYNLNKFRFGLKRHFRSKPN